MKILLVNKNGKLSFLASVASFVLCVLATYKEYYSSDAANPMLSLFLNYIARPVYSQLYSLFSEPLPPGPVATRMNIFPLFESEAIIFFYILGSILALVAFYYSAKAAKDHEFTFWYTNGVVWGLYALFVINVYFGAVAMVLVVPLVLNVRGKVKYNGT